MVIRATRRLMRSIGSSVFRSPRRPSPPEGKETMPYSPMVRTTLDTGRVLFTDSLFCCISISSYFGTVVTGARGTTCTTL
jgi:hypothetical protein